MTVVDDTHDSDIDDGYWAAITREADLLSAATARRPQPAQPDPGQERHGLPHDDDLERAVIGTAITWPHHAGNLLALLKADDLYRPSHRAAWDAIAWHVANDQPPDARLVAARLTSIDGAAHLVMDCQSAAVGPAVALAYTDTLRDLAQRRRGLLATEQATAALLDRAVPILAALDPLGRLIGEATSNQHHDHLGDGGSFVLDVPDTTPAVWGEGDDILWAEGEPLYIVGHSGVGKTTVCGQLIRARLGITDNVLGYPVAHTGGRILYLAMDRPKQARRSMSRQFSPEHRALLEDRLSVWSGPPPADIARHPTTLLSLAERAKADLVIIDSLKDAALKLSDDEVGAGLNRAVQLCVANGVEVLGLHHQRKSKDGGKPKSLDEIYGSTWIAAGAGSVLLLHGEPGDPLVELIHLKQPAGVVGPLKIEHGVDGTSSVYSGFDALAFLRNRPHGASARQAAKAMFNKVEGIERHEELKAKRRLDDLVKRGLATVREGERGEDGKLLPNLYLPTVSTAEEAS